MSLPKPKITRERAIELFERSGHFLSEYKAGVMLTIRGYYRDTKGVEGKNDVGIFDDALIWIGHKSFLPITANSDPSKIGWNLTLGKPYAMLVPGLWHFIRGDHKGRRPAFRQPNRDQGILFNAPDRGQFKVYRAKKRSEVEQRTAKTETGYFNINIHDADSEDNTSSWGCLTAPKEEFIPWATKIWGETRAVGQDLIPNFVIENPEGDVPQLTEQVEISASPKLATVTPAK